VTPLEHMVADYEEGPERSRAEHYEQWARLVVVEDGESEAQSVARARELEAAAYSIHMHVWTQAELLQLILGCRERFGEAFDIEASARNGIEFMVVLRKRGPYPAPATQPGAARPLTPARIWSGLKRRARVALQRARSAD
jgi:hypothetical protein